jgi:hypothetical protein
MQVQIDTKVFLSNAITNMEAAIIVVCGLHGSQIGEKAKPDGYVDVEVIDVFIPSAIVPFVEITKDLAV